MVLILHYSALVIYINILMWVTQGCSRRAAFIIFLGFIMAVLNLAYQIFRFCVLSRGIPETNQLKTILHCNMFGKYTCGLLFFAGLFMTILLYGK